MANFGRGWGDGYGSQSDASVQAYQDEQALNEGDWEWLSKSPRQKRLREEQGLKPDEYAAEPNSN